MMQTSEPLENLIETLLWDLIILADRVKDAADEATCFKLNCTEMVKQVSQLSQMLDALLCFTTMNPSLLTYFYPIHCVISEVSTILREALTLVCSCKRKTIFSGLLSRAKTSQYFHKLYHHLDNSVANMKWFLILYNPEFESAFHEIFLSIPRILCYDSSALSAWSFLATETMIWKLTEVLTSDEAVPLELTASCVEALSMLDIRSAINSGMIKEIDGMLKEVERLMVSLAKLVEASPNGEKIQFNCLMIIVEITCAVEYDLDLRCKAFKTNSPGAKAIVQQLLRVIEESENPSLQVLAIRSIGSLARIFCARKNHHVIRVLVLQLDNGHRETATEAVVALQKFASPDNHLRKLHSMKMIEFNAVQPLMKLLKEGEKTQRMQGLELFWYLFGEC